MRPQYLIHDICAAHLGQRAERAPPRCGDDDPTRRVLLYFDGLDVYAPLRPRASIWSVHLHKKGYALFRSTRPLSRAQYPRDQVGRSAYSDG